MIIEEAFCVPTVLTHRKPPYQRGDTKGFFIRQVILKYFSVCSGIEAASCAWEPLGWKPSGFSEIEPFPCAVLANRFPNVKNYGDMTKYKEWENVGQFDVLVGGTPCQSFSVAGLRKGLNDPRGNLMLTFGAIADHFKPAWIVWENVPGVISSNDRKDFSCFLDMLEELGYIIDVDIPDAQFFGVPQRRRRVFVCGQRIDYLLNKKTSSSALTIIQCLQEISQKLLVVALYQSGNERQSLDYQNLLKDGMIRRMKLFGLVGDCDNSKILQENLTGAFQRFLQEQNNSVVSRGEYERELIQEGRLTDSQTAGPYTLTGQSLKKILEESLEAMKSCITLTGIKTITQSEIFLSSKLVLLTGKLTVLLSRSSPSFWSAASSSLIALKEYTNYARQTTSDLFGDMERIHYWRDFIGQAVRLQEFIGRIGVTNFGQILSVTASLSGHPPPSREAGKAVAGTISTRTSGGGGLGTDFELSGGLQVAHTLRGEGFDASEDGTGRGTPIVPVQCFERNTPDGHARLVGEIAPTLNRIGGGQREPCIFTPVVMSTGQGNAEITEGHAPTLNCNHEAPILALAGNTIGREPENGGNGCGYQENVSYTLTKTDIHGVCIPFRETADCLTSAYGTKWNGNASADNGSLFARHGSAVRRLTPRECERLQGFPDDWTRIPWRGATAENCPDGPRYKACGNSMAVPVMRWIGERIADCTRSR